MTMIPTPPNTDLNLYNSEPNAANQWLACPHCGHEHSFPFEPIEVQLIRAVNKLARHSGAAHSQAIALEVSLSRSQAVRRLNELERRGLVRRVGQRGGWRAA